MKNPVAHLNSIVDDLMDSYQDLLYEAKVAKTQAAHNKVSWNIWFTFLVLCN